jgi:hypothetical protein
MIYYVVVVVAGIICLALPGAAQWKLPPEMEAMVGLKDPAESSIDCMPPDPVRRVMENKQGMRLMQTHRGGG